jgi:hypothetical protein
MEELNKYLQELVDEGIIHYDVKSDIKFLGRKGFDEKPTTDKKN